MWKRALKTFDRWREWLENKQLHKYRVEKNNREIWRQIDFQSFQLISSNENNFLKMWLILNNFARCIGTKSLRMNIKSGVRRRKVMRPQIKDRQRAYCQQCVNIGSKQQFVNDNLLWCHVKFFNWYLGRIQNVSIVLLFKLKRDWVITFILTSLFASAKAFAWRNTV